MTFIAEENNPIPLQRSAYRHSPVKPMTEPHNCEHDDHAILADSAIVVEKKAETPAGISLDNMGIIASVICVIHCVSMPLLVTVLPMMGAEFLESDFTHEVLAAFVFIFAISALLPGYLKRRDNSILAGMLVGLGLVMFATFFSESMLGSSWELPLISIGNLIIVMTHLRNRKHENCTHD